MSHIFLLGTWAGEGKTVMNTKIRIPKHEYRNKFESRMIKIPNNGLPKESFLSLQNLDLGIVSDFGFRISNLIIHLPKQKMAPGVQRASYG